VRPLVNTCKRWRNIIHRTQSFWVVEYITSFKGPSLVKELEQCRDDIDLTLRLNSNSVESDLRWIQERVLPFAHLYQKLVVTFEKVGNADVVFQELTSVMFPRLRSASFASPHNFILGPSGLKAPRLMSLSTRGCSLLPEEYPFPNLNSRATFGHRHIPWLQKDITLILNPSISSLVHLVLRNLFLGDKCVSDQGDWTILHLPRLAKLELNGSYSVQLIYFLSILDAPALVHLILETNGPGYSVDFGRRMSKSLHFGLVRCMSIKSPANCLPYLLRHLQSVPSLQHLSLNVTRGHTLQNLRILRNKVEFKRLLEFRLQWSTRLNTSILSWLLESFDFSSTTKFVKFSSEISLGKRNLSFYLPFPNLEKLEVSPLDNLANIHLSSGTLHHLCVELSKDMRPWYEWYELFTNANSQYWKKITTLRLKLPPGISCIPGQSWQAKHFPPLCELITLIITYRPGHKYEEEPWDNFSHNRPLEIKPCDLFLLKMITLQVNILHSSTKNRSKKLYRDVETAIRDIKLFVLCRKEIGYPIRLLKLTFSDQDLFSRNYVLIEDLRSVVDTLEVTRYK